MSLLLNYLGLLAGAAIIAVLLSYIRRLRHLDPVEASKSASRAASWRHATTGRTRPIVDWMPDARVEGGLVYNKKAGRFEITGRLSKDSIRRAFGG